MAAAVGVGVVGGAEGGGERDAAAAAAGGGRRRPGAALGGRVPAIRAGRLVASSAEEEERDGEEEQIRPRARRGGRPPLPLRVRWPASSGPTCASSNAGARRSPPLRSLGSDRAATLIQVKI